MGAVFIVSAGGNVPEFASEVGDDAVALDIGPTVGPRSERALGLL